MEARYFSGAFSGSFSTAAKITAPATALAVMNSPGGVMGASGGARLPPLKNAPRPAHPAAVPNCTSCAAFIALRRFSSLGCAIHFSVADNDAWILGDGFDPEERRAHTHA